MFDKSFETVIGHEGGYVNDSHDPGGETKYGISKRSYPTLNIKDLTLQEAKEIYLRDYWCKANINLLPEHLQVTMFDSVVLHGIYGGTRILQQACELKTDGIIGPRTIEQSKKITETRLLLFRLSKYIDLCVGRPSLLKYLNGWRNRVFSLLDDNL